MSSSEARNLEAISKAIDDHNARCAYPAVAVVMNPFEVERLGWETIRGLPLVGDPQVATGRFNIICSGDGADDEELEQVEAIGEPVHVGAPDPPIERPEFPV